MTQTFSVITRRCVFHVSDRLLTQGTTQFDPNSNKTVVFRAPDAQVIVGYSGRAYLDGLPTDTFIAQALIGVSLSGTGALIPVGKPASWVDIGRAVERLRVECEAALQRLPISDQVGHGLEISIVGWRQRPRNLRITPLVWTIDRPKGGNWSDLKVMRHLRWWPWYRNYMLVCVPDPPEGIIESVRADLRRRGNISPLEIKKVLVEGLQRCAEAAPERIGKDCLYAFLTPTSRPQLRVEYVRGGINQSSTSEPAQEGYSPWIVAPPMVWAPAELSVRGGWDQKIGGDFAWRIEGAEPTSGRRLFSHSSQQRPRDPQSRS